MLNLFGRIAATTQPYSPADPFAPPQNSNDPRITEIKRGYRTRCWLWRDPATADAARIRVWEDRHKREARFLVNKCGHPRCIRLTHLDSLSERDYDDLRQIQSAVQSVGGGRAGVAAAFQLIRKFSMRMEGRQGWNEPAWPLLLNVAPYELTAGMDDGQQAHRELLRQNLAARQSEATPMPAASEAPPMPAIPEASPAPDDALPPLPPLPPSPPPAGPLGNPTNLTAQHGDTPGSVILTWTPALNATAHRICYRIDGTDWQGEADQLLPGSMGEATLPQVKPAGRWHFIVIAGQQGSDGAMTWSEWSNWATITVS